MGYPAIKLLYFTNSFHVCNSSDSMHVLEVFYACISVYCMHVKLAIVCM